MFCPTLTMKSLKNKVTGIDLSVPVVNEVEAPLGGTSTEYEILILTNLQRYKTHLHKDQDVVQFSIQKAYREVEDLYVKILKKFQAISLPSVPRGRSVPSQNSEEKRIALDAFFKCISENQEICNSTLLIQFIGHQSCKKPTDKPIEKSVLPDDLNILGQNELDIDKITKVSDSSNTVKRELKSTDTDNNITHDIEEHDSDDDDDMSELFPKVKVIRGSKTDVVIKRVETESDLSPVVTERVETDFDLSPATTKEVNQEQKSKLSDNLDLFEEVKQIKASQKQDAKQSESHKNVHHDLFDDLYDPDDALFSTPNDSLSSIHSAANQNVDVTHLNDKPSVAARKENYTSELNCSKEKTEIVSDFLSEEKRNGGISLFPDQDFGTSFTKDEESLFFVPDAEAKGAKNPFLSRNIVSSNKNEISESLDDLLKLSEPNLITPKTEKVATDICEEKKLPPRPVPKPRTKIPAHEDVVEKPQAAPRKMSKPLPPTSKPMLPAKPSLPPKPKIAKKPEVAQNKSQVQTESSQKSHIVEHKKDSVDDLSNFDILQYIEQEQKAAISQTDLFD